MDGLEREIAKQTRGSSLIVFAGLLRSAERAEVCALAIFLDGRLPPSVHQPHTPVSRGVGVPDGVGFVLRPAARAQVLKAVVARDTVLVVYFAFWPVAGHVVPSEAVCEVVRTVNPDQPIADVVDVSTRLLTSAEGLPFNTRYQVISAEETSPGHIAKYVLQSYALTGGGTDVRYGYYMPSDAPIYADATEVQKALGGWYAGTDGLISGDPGYEYQ